MNEKMNKLYERVSKLVKENKNKGESEVKAQITKMACVFRLLDKRPTAF